jgi:hypothetical protein
MHKEIEYKKQGDGRDSWAVTEWETAAKKVMLNKYMVYEDPNQEPKKVDISNIDIDTLNDSELTKLANKLKPKLGL